MHLELYAAFYSWDKFVAAFTPMSVVADPTNVNEGHWRLEHPTHPIRFYAPVLYGKNLSGHVLFDYQDVTPVGHEDWWLDHPLWAGLFRVLTSWPAMLVVQPLG